MRGVVMELKADALQADLNLKLAKLSMRFSANPQARTRHVLGGIVH